MLCRPDMFQPVGGLPPHTKRDPARLLRRAVSLFDLEHDKENGRGRQSIGR
jgi:hypothetical protein